LLVGFASSAQAALLAELSLNDCDAMGCEGSTLYLAVEDAVDYGYTEGFVITYTIDTTNYTGDRDGFNQVGFKVIKDWDVTGNNDVLSAPGDPTGDSWDPVYDDPINSGSPNSEVCQTSAGDNTSKVCLNGFVNITAGGTYTWVIYLEEGTLMDVSEWHLGAQYANNRYRSVGKIISAQVPEPTAAVLFGLGAILVTRSARRR
jgi:hypothetical protein